MVEFHWCFPEKTPKSLLLLFFCEIYYCSLPNRQLRKQNEPRHDEQSGSLPNRQLRKANGNRLAIIKGSLPNRQLRKVTR